MSERGYKTIALSIYDGDLERLDQQVADMKARGYRRASRAQVIRLALRMLDTSNALPPSEIPFRIESRPPDAADVEESMPSERDADPPEKRRECICEGCGQTFHSQSRTLVSRWCFPCRTARKLSQNASYRTAAKEKASTKEHP